MSEPEQGEWEGSFARPPAGEKRVIDTEPPGQRLDDIHMPSGPEQPARVSSTGSTGADSPEGEELISVAEQLLIMKREVDLLQIEIAKPAMSWYRQIPVIVSVAALILSLMTTAYSERRATQQDLHNARVELRELISQNDELTISMSEIASQYKDNPAAQNLAQSSATTSRVILANQAANVLDELGDDVTATEYLAVGSALFNLGTYDARVSDFYQRGLKLPADVITKTALYRGLANAYFGKGQIEEGRKAFEGALSASSEVHLTKAFNDGYTQYAWAIAELLARSCVESRNHLQAARQAYDSFEAGGGVLPAGYRDQLNAFSQTLENRC